MHATGHLRDHRTAPTILIGNSLGGSAVLAAAEQTPEVRAVPTIGAPADTEHLLHLLADSRAEVDETGDQEVMLGTRAFRIRREFLDDITSHPQGSRIRRLRAALLVTHSPTVETVASQNARRIPDIARHPRSLVSLDGAGHLLTDAADARFAATRATKAGGQELVHHSGRVLQALSHQPNGAIVAAATTSVPRAGRRRPQLGLPILLGA